MKKQGTTNVLTMGTKLSYAVGNIGLQMLVAAMSFFLMIFYTDVALVPPAIAGAALLVGKVWDTINDPLFGWVADRTRSRHGRRRVYLIYGIIPLAIATAAVWMVPPGLDPIYAFLWVAISYTLFDTMLTMVQIPYSALAAEMTRDYDERTSLSVTASFGALGGYMLGSLLMPMLVQSAADDASGYALAGAVFGIIAGASIGWVAWHVKEPALDKLRKQSSPPWRVVRAALRNRPFVMLVLATGLVRLGLTLVQAALAYYIIYQLQGSKSDLPQLITILLCVVGMTMYVWKRLVDLWEKNFAYIVGLSCSVIGLTSLYWIEPGQENILMGMLVVIGIGMGSHWVVPFSMIPDTVDHGHMQEGERRSGVYMGLYGLIDKIARTVATVSMAAILELSGYVPNVAQTPEALQGIRLAAGPLPALCLALAIPLLLVYPITRARHADLKQALDSSGAQ
ncbi:MAG: MFS transporter [Candidatus Thiodiazotropha sp.]